MADSLSIELSKAIMTAFSGSLLSDDLSGRLFEDEVPEDVKDYPRAVYFVVTSNPDDPFCESLEITLLQFSLFSISKSSLEIKTMESHLDALFNKKMLNVAGQRMVYSERKNKVTMTESIITPEGTQSEKHYAIEYEITAQA